MRRTSNTLDSLTTATLLVTLTLPTFAQAGELPPAAEGPVQQLASRAVPQPTAPLATTPTTPPPTLHQWTARQHRLKVQLGVSAGFTAAFALIGVLLIAIPVRCPDDPEIDCEPYGRWIAALTMIPATVISAIPTAVYSVRLHRHNRQRPVAQLQLAPGGLALRFW